MENVDISQVEEKEKTYERYYNWAFAIAKEIIRSKSGTEKGKELIKKLIYEIRGEETPGRFFNRLTQKLGEYKINVNIQADVSIHNMLFKENWYGDKFFYLKSAILAGFLNALVERQEGKGEEKENDISQ
jgi:hypothetical protein